MVLTADQTDALKELLNIGVGKAAAVLNEMIDSHVQLQVPSLRVAMISQLEEQLTDENDSRLASVRLGFNGAFSGDAMLVFPTDSAAKLVSILTGEEPESPDLDSIRIGAITEVGNILMNGVMGSIGNVLDQQINYSIPTYTEDTLDKLLAISDLENRSAALLAETRFIVEQLHIEGDIILAFEVGSFDALLDIIDSMLDAD